MLGFSFSGSVKQARRRSRLLASRRSSSVIVMYLLDCVRPVGVNADAVHVGHDQERRVLQRDGKLL